MLLANATLPFSGLTRNFSPLPGSASSILVFTSSTTCFSLKYASLGGSLSSKIRRSILLTIRTMGRSTSTACLIASSVCTCTPSTTSTTNTTASASRMEAATSSAKLTWPGVSMMLMRCVFPLVLSSGKDMGLDLIDTPRSCSRMCVSVYLNRSSRAFPVFPL